MSRVLAIDPGNTESGYAVIDVETRKPILFGKVANFDLRAMILDGSLLAGVDEVAIEMVATYGMPVGASVFETCVWIGRFIEVIDQPSQLVFRSPVRAHHCHSNKAKDANVRQALVDRFAPGASNYGKGTKADPGWFHGFRADVWQAYALAIYVADQLEEAA